MFMGGKNYQPPENVQLKVIEQVFTGEPSEKSYSPGAQRNIRKSSKTSKPVKNGKNDKNDRNGKTEKKRPSKPIPPPVDFN